MNNQIREDIDSILAHLPTLATPHTTGDYDPQASVRFIDIHVYDLASNEEEPSIIESTVQSYDATPNSEQTLPEEETTPPSRYPLTRWYVWTALVMVCCVLMTGTATILFLVPTWTPLATVTIIPVSKQITTTSTITVVPGAADLVHHQLAGRVFSSVTMSQARTIATTGISHQDAKAGHGFITFYNAATSAQTVTAGTLLTGADGVQVITEQDAIISAASYPTFGQASVRAQSAITGPGGNIRAGDIYGPCCRLNVSAVSSTFSGGQEARDYQMVTLQDINTVTAGLKTSLNQSVQAALQTQAHSDETLIIPLPCQQSITADHQPGDEATQISITEGETCTGEAYSTNAYHDLMTQIVSQEVTKQFGAGYTSTGDIQTQITQTSLGDQNLVTLQVTGAGTWAYQFDPTRQQSMINMIVGKNKTQALALLLHVPGVHSASISVTTGATIPTDSAHIRLVCLLLA